VIPNLVKLADKEFPKPVNDVFTIGFLSRVDPKKGLDILIKALSKVDFEYKLVIAGSGDQSYINKLRNLSNKYGNSKNIEWVGWKGGETKFEFLSQIDLMALTSHSENFAIVVIESLSVGTPVFISKMVGLFKYIADKDFGWVTDMNIENVTGDLNKLYQEKDRFIKINAEAPFIIKQEYEENTLADRYIQLYNFAKTN
jgi:glycosyltransferase involved in cell wall biosynthesis